MRKCFAIVLAAFLLAGILPAFGCSKKGSVATRYEITAEYVPENKTLAGTVKVTFENDTREALSVLKFQAYPNAYRKNALYKPVSTAYADAAYYAGESYGEMVISSVHGSKGWELMGEDENILCVELERELYPGDRVVLDIGFLTKLANVEHRTGITQSTVNLGNFFPILCHFENGGFVENVYYSDGDPFVSDCAEYKVRLTLPKEYEVASTGEITGERTLERKKEHTMYAMNARDFACVLYKNAQVLTEKVGNTLISYYYFADQTPADTFATVKEAFTYYGERFGEYPFPTYTVAETGLCFGGQEYPRLTMLSDGIKKEEKARAIAHEVAHQWWYCVVGSDQVQNAWQDEGLAEYSALCFFEKYEKYGFTREALVTAALREYRSYYDVYGSVLGRADTRMTRHLKEFISDYEYKCLAVDKTVVMLDTLRKSIGDKKFFHALEKYYSACAYQIASVGDFVGSFERAGVDVAGFFESFLEGKAVL